MITKSKKSLADNGTNRQKISTDKKKANLYHLLLFTITI